MPRSTMVSMTAFEPVVDSGTAGAVCLSMGRSTVPGWIQEVSAIVDGGFRVLTR